MAEIPVLGMDPSLRSWGLAETTLDLSTGIPTIPHLTVIEPEDLKGKQVRQNSKDLWLAEQLSGPVMAAARKAKVIFVEVPVGSQSARAMASYGVCVGILGAVRALGIPLIEVTATESKVIFAGDKNATKQQMINAGLAFYPAANWPRYEQSGKGFTKGDIHSKAEHVADAIAAIHSGVRTPVFQNLMRLFAEV